MHKRRKKGAVLAALRIVARLGVPAGILAACALALSTRLNDLTMEVLVSHFEATDAWQWMLSMLLCGVSFWAVGRYDAVAHRHIRTGLPDRQARRSGTIAIALAQTLGFGLVTGALARWRLLPGLSGRSALKLAAFVAFSFMAALGVVTAVALVLLPGPAGSFWPALAITLALPGFAWLLFRYPEPVIFGHVLRLPSLRGFSAILLWTALDVVAAAGALYLLLPSGTSVGFAALLPVFMLALCAALLSGTPGGIGPFELVILTLLPQVSHTGMLSAIVAFRALYYALPAVTAAIMLLRPFREAPEWRNAAHPVPEPRDYPRSELGVMRQNGGRWMLTETGGLVVWATAQTFTGLLDPISENPRRLLRDLASVARNSNRVACLYKCSAPVALAARHEGWSVLHVADEAVLDLGGFTLDVPARRTLRRKLRAASKAGLRFDLAPRPDWAALARIDRAWQEDRGPARGGTMGRFEIGYLRHQMIVTASLAGEIVAFASFHASAHEWCLDLVRMHPEAPDGAMHGIVAAAMEAARHDGAARLSLAAVPACPDPSSAIHRDLAMRASALTGAPGLRQFKSAFAPRWQPLYLAAPSRIALLIAALDIARVVLTARPAADTGDPVHMDDENNAFACRRAS
ncbi:phosphatidylglycerol lysyltransferase domain-containing protein [Sulfitobacter sp. LCG007]